MNTLDYFCEFALPSIGILLPSKMDTLKARAMIVAACLQESRFTDRRQMGNGPARSFAQMEKGGMIAGVLSQSSTKTLAAGVCKTLAIPATANAVYEAVEYNDVLCACFARLGMWASPLRLPEEYETDYAWEFYASKTRGIWRPGKPHRPTWNAFWKQAWAKVKV